MKHFLIALALIVGASSIFVPSTAVASCADKCSKALEKGMDKCGKARSPRMFQGCMTYVQKKFYACQRGCARKGTSTDAVEMSRGAQVPNDFMEKIKARCASKWDTNYRMQKYCRKRQTKGFLWTSTFVDKHKLGTKPYPTKTVQFKVAAKCWGKWTDEYGQNWPMVTYCIKRQMAAYRSL